MTSENDTKNQNGNEVSLLVNSKNDRTTNPPPQSQSQSQSQSQPLQPSSPLSTYLAEKLYGPKGYFGSIVDDQRLERLTQCVELEQALENCQIRKLKLQFQFQQEQQLKQLMDRKKEMEQEQRQRGRFLRRSWEWLWSSSSSNSSNDDQMNNGTKVLNHKKIKKKIKAITNIDDDNNNFNNEKNNNKIIMKRLEETRGGMKISRFYNWGLSNPETSSKIAEMRGFAKGEDETTNESIFNKLKGFMGDEGNGNSGSSSSSNKDDNSMRQTPESSNSSNNDKATTTTQSKNKTNNNNTEEINKNHTKNKTTSKNRNKVQNKNENDCCSMEKHALYACRALALGCVPNLVELKESIHQESLKENSPN